MSGIEVGLAVISAVAALVAAFEKGDKVVARIKKRRAKRGAVQPSEELEKALKNGETDMTRLKAEGANLRTDGKFYTLLTLPQLTDSRRGNTRCLERPGD